MTNPLDIFRKESPGVADAFNNLIQAIVTNKGVDEKTKQLIYIALKAAEGDATALLFHVPEAKRLGATRTEVADTIILTLTVRGLKGITTCLPVAMSFFDDPPAAMQA